MGNYSFKWCLKKPKPTKCTQKPPTVFHEQVCFLSFYPVTWWKLWFGFLFLTEMLVFDTLLLYKLTKAAHCNEVMESQGMKMKHGISYFSIVISPCFQGISEAVLLRGGCYLFTFLFQYPASYPDAKAVVCVPVLLIFMWWEVFSSGTFLLLPQVLGTAAWVLLLQSQFIPQFKIWCGNKRCPWFQLWFGFNLSLSTKKRFSAPFIK